MKGPGSNNNTHGTHVWVRTDLVEAIWKNNGNLPAGWRPGKRGRSTEASWGWARALVSNNPTTSSTSTAANAAANSGLSPNRQAVDVSKKATSPFGTVKLRKITNSPMVQERSAPTSPFRSTGSPERVSKTVTITVTIDDPELASPELQNVTVTFTYNTGEYSKVCMANPWWLSHDDEPPTDLCSLTHLHEPAVVFCLQQRYQADYIYTYTGKILLALNPFRALQNVYSEDIMQQYWQQDFTQGRPPPHIYAVAEDAYRSMMRSLQLHQSENQSILVSGESGAGKTVTTKIIMRYLATLSQRSDQARGAVGAGVGIESQVLQSNPILESFGNARTIRNDNSSRFGKFIEIQFEESGCLVSASIETYLLEKVRLISQAPGERNYHLFYELLVGLPQKDRRDLCIGNKSARDFKMTANSGTFDRRDGVDDKQTYQELRSALDTVGFTRDEQKDLFTVACALLHTSNLTFKESAADASELDRSNAALRSAVSLLGVEADALNDALCRCAIEARGETLYKNLSIERAEKAVEALIKTTYTALFDHIVQRINSFITVQKGSANGNRTASTASIGVLDIFGFESFEFNSFEQLCINFCNEALQQQFNRFVFKLEQQEYQKEGIEWSFISFPDNQDVIDLIEKKHDGILSVLDEQCRLPRCTDRSFAGAIYAKCLEHPRFEATKGQQADLAFGVYHYAGLVEYDTEGFLEKNKDELPKETTELLLSSSYPFLALLGQELSEDAMHQKPVAARGAAGRRQLHRASSSIMRDSVGSQFSSQLRVLRTRIESTSPHYVRCLKPNDDLVPNNFNHLVMADQLRCAGVLEAIRVSRVGFPHRFSHDHFVQRYGVLVPGMPSKFGRKEKGQVMCEYLVEALVPDLSVFLEQSESNEELVVKGRQGKRIVFLGMQMGRTKVFLRRRAFEALEHLRGAKIDNSAALIQSMARTFLARKQFKIAVAAATAIQTFVRHIASYREIQAQRLENAATTIKNAWKCYIPRRRLRAAQSVAWWCQSMYRGSIARQYCAYLFLDQKASSIQRGWISYRSSRTFRRIRRAMVYLQNRHRARVATRELYRLRREAKDLSSVAAERDKLRKETRQLKMELEQAKQASPVEHRSPQRKAEEVERLKTEVQRLRLELEKAHRMTSPSMSVDDDMQSLFNECARKEAQLDTLRRELDSVRGREFPESPPVLGRSFTLNGSPTKARTVFDLASPVRSDVSLLDAEGDGLAPAEGAFSFMQERADRQDQMTNSSFASLDVGEAPTEAEIRHLHASIRRGNNDLFDRILRQSNEPIALINQGDKYGRTSLHLAALSLNLQLTETLIANGAVANTQDDDGETPLHLSDNVAMTELLLKKGNANSNIPNVDGICALHLAVQRRDVDSVRTLLRHGASVNNADNIRWFTALHLISLPARNETDEKPDEDCRARIGQLLSGSMYGQGEPDFNYQDSEGNTPLHYAVQLETPEALELVTIFLEKGSDANICNERYQSPLHLLCHNEELRTGSIDEFQEILHVMLFHGADPNLQSLTGCTPLHLSLYHRDVDSAVQLVSHGAELHVLWRKPSRWASFWEDMGGSEILALDMVEDEASLHRILAAVTRPVKWAPTRSWCMHCKTVLGTYARALHCRNCSRLVCGSCAPTCLPAEDFPKSFEATDAAWVCTVCEKVLASRKEDVSSGTQPTSSYGDDEDDRFSC